MYLNGSGLMTTAKMKENRNLTCLWKLIVQVRVVLRRTVGVDGGD